jgi:two-component system, OmpR family, alkaline phosphatase synthesis response regulator PhoP
MSVQTPHILMVEDEPDIIELVTFHIHREGYSFSAISDPNLLLGELATHQPDLIILDLMLPGKNGYDICKSLKNNPTTEHIPILIISAKSEETDIVTGLELGADDYLPKPFSPKVLIARIRALIRRSTPAAPTPATEQPDCITLHGLTILPNSHQVTYNNTAIELNTSELKTLLFLAEKPGWVFSRYQIVEAIRGENHFVTDRTIDVLIVGLRKKLGAAGSLIETVRGAGYRMKPL